MLIFWRLILGHFLADFTFQSNKMNDWKRSSRMGLIAHSLMHPICFIILTYPYLWDTWVEVGGFALNGAAAIILITVFHYLEDEWRVFTIKRFGTPDNTIYMLWDQFIHGVAIFLFSSALIAKTGIWIPEKWPIVITLGVISTHFSVVIMYFIEKDLYGSEFPGDFEKHVAIVERGLAFASLALIPNAILAFVVALASLFVVRLGFSFKKPSKRLSRFSWIWGSVLALLCALGARLLLSGGF
ncbi:DUF3307 domain-containing protein [Elusimicrobiota bacterium]